MKLRWPWHKHDSGVTEALQQAQQQKAEAHQITPAVDRAAITARYLTRLAQAFMHEAEESFRRPKES